MITKDQTKRKQAIALLEITVEKHAHAIREQEILLSKMLVKQVKRIAELRCQKLLLQMAEYAERKAKETQP